MYVYCSPPDIPSDLDSVTLDKFPDYVRSLHKDDCLRAMDEYDYIKDLDPPVSRRTAMFPCNEQRNRYINILPSIIIRYC